MQQTEKSRVESPQPHAARTTRRVMPGMHALYNAVMHRGKRIAPPLPERCVYRG